MTKVEITRSEATNEAYIYSARLIVGMLIDYFPCIALKIVVLEMIALIKKWTIKSLGIRNFIKINQVLVLPITGTPGDIQLGKKTKLFLP